MLIAEIFIPLILRSVCTFTTLVFGADSESEEELTSDFSLTSEMD